jgi:Large extracellular alpha-helical protein
MLSFLLSGFLSLSFAQQKVTATQVFPEGTVKNVTQIRIRFAKPMVKLGELSLQIPAESECFKNGAGRWADTQNWVYDFKEALPGGTRCVVSIQGEKFEFNTGGASITNTFPDTYRHIETDQNFVLVLDSPVDATSVEKNAFFLVQGLGDKLPVEVIKDTTELFKAAEEEYSYSKEDFRKNLIAVRSKRAFPVGEKVTLMWPKSVRSASGVESVTDQSFEFKVQQPFKAEMSCERETSDKPCIPLTQITVNLTSNIKIADARAIYVQLPDGKKVSAENLENQSDKNTLRSMSFKGPFPAMAELQLVMPVGLKDEDGRALTNQNQFPLKFKTADYPVLLKFAADFGVIEAGPDAAAAVTLRHVEKNLPTKFEAVHQRMAAPQFAKIIQRLDMNVVDDKPMATPAGVTTQRSTIKKPLAEKETEVVGIPLKQKGFYTIEVKSPRLGVGLREDKAPLYIRSNILVTDMAVHIKYTSSEVMAWVTELKSAQPVAKAKVYVISKKGKVQATGISDSNGLVKLAVRGEEYEPFYVMAEKAGDFTFVSNTWDRGIESWRYQMAQGDRLGPVVGHAIMDRTLLRPDETLSAKLVLRRSSAKGLSIPGKTDYPSEISLMHDSGGQTFKVPLKWDIKAGTANLTWKIPQGVRLGRWSLHIQKNNQYYLEIGDLRVEYFRVPLMKAQIISANKQLIQEKNPKFNVGAEYLAGGVAGKLPMTLRYSVEPFNPEIQNDDYQDYQWMNGGVKAGLFRSGDDQLQTSIPQSGKQELMLDQAGGAQIQIKDLKYALSPQKLRAEVEFKDPNGEIQNVGRAFSMWPADRMVGIRAKSWWAKKDRVDFDVAVLDLDQKPQANVPVRVDLYTSNYITHRKRLVGGFYAYEDFQEIRKLGELCNGKTNARGILECSGKSNFAGSVVAVVTAKDSQGREATAKTQQWIIGDNVEQWFGSQDNDRVDLIPFKRSYEPGENAQLQLRTPFSKSKVLLTIEREGVLDAKVVEVNSENPSFEIPIKAEYAPNVVISAFAIRGRVDTSKPTALLDLAKPAFKLGMTELKVGWKQHQLKVEVTTDKNTYQVRESAKVKVKVTDAQGKPAANAEVSLAAVDEGLLELRDNKSWDILSSMMALHQHKVMTATVQSFIVGKRHFGLKALPIGGDGRGNARELFETLLYWNPTVKLNTQGEATLTIPLNDSLTSFRIVGVAMKGADQFGTGWNRIQSSQDLMIFSGIAGTARQGDEMSVEYTLRNTSAKPLDLTAALQTVPALPGMTAQQIRLAPQESKTLSWKVKVPQNISLIEYNIMAKSLSGQTLDRMKKTQKVLPVLRPEIYQTQMGQFSEFKDVDVALMKDSVPGSNSVIVDVSSSLVGSQAGMLEYWKNYPYTCLEQQVSRAVSLQDKKAWDQLAAKLSLYTDASGFLKYFPDSHYGSANLTAYVLALVHESGWSMSDEMEERLTSALKNFVEGRRAPPGMSRADDDLQKLTAMEALSRYRKLDLNAVTAMSYTLEQWPLHSLVEWYEILRWEKGIPQRDVKLKQVEQILRSRMYFSAKRFKFQDENLDFMSWLMRTPDLAGIRLVLATMDDNAWTQDMGRMVLGVLDRQTQGSWNMTTANAWGTLMLKKYSERFEKVKPQGTMQVVLNKEEMKIHDWKKPAGSFEFALENETNKVEFKQVGSGNPWVTASLKAAKPLTEQLAAGYWIERKMIPVEQKKPNQWSRGDIAKVQLKVKAQTPMSWVVVNDPIPSGATVLGSGLGRDSQVLNQNTVNDLWSDFVERGQDSVKFYYSWFPQGEFTIEYTVRFNQAGRFQLPQSRVEAMYSPDLFGESPNSPLQVVE